MLIYELKMLTSCFGITSSTTSWLMMRRMSESNGEELRELFASLDQKLDAFTLSKARAFIHESVKLETYLQGEMKLIELEKLKFAQKKQVDEYINALKVLALGHSTPRVVSW